LLNVVIVQLSRALERRVAIPGLTAGS